MRLISSPLALRVCVALASTDGLTLTELGRAVTARPSAVQRALALLVGDEVVDVVRGTRPRYALRQGERAALVTDLALTDLTLAAAAAIAARANRCIELIALRRRELVVVFRPHDLLTQAPAARLAERLAARSGLVVRYLDHDDVRRELLADPGLRRTMRCARILAGDVDATFPDRSGHGRRRGAVLHRAHRTLRRPPRALLARLRRAHGLERIALFGSAVRSDFRPDSDVDVLIRYRPTAHPTLRSLLAIERALEDAFGRDVDLVREETLPADVRERVSAEAVPLA